MFCSRCGREMPNNASVCPYCGYTPNNNTYQTANPQEYGNMHENRKKIRLCKIFSFLPMILILIALIWLRTDSGKIFVNDVEAYFNNGENYIEMVQDTDIEMLDTTYGELLSQCFVNREWSYFKTDDGERVVELNCTEDAFNSDICMQFLITPAGSDMYHIELAYSSVNDVSVQDIFSWIYDML